MTKSKLYRIALQRAEISYQKRVARRRNKQVSHEPIKASRRTHRKQQSQQVLKSMFRTVRPEFAAPRDLPRFVAPVAPSRRGLRDRVLGFARAIFAPRRVPVFRRQSA